MTTTTSTPWRAALLAAALLVPLASATAATPAGAVPVTLTATDTTAGRIDGGASTRSLTISEPGEVTGVTVTVTFAKIDDSGGQGSCDPLVNGPGVTWNNEAYLRLTSPAGTSVDLLRANTYVAEGYGGRVDVTFDDAASAPPSGVPATGTFRPAEPLATFAGEAAQGSWVLTIGDTHGGDPVCFDAASLSITADQNTVPAAAAGPDQDVLPDATVALDGTGSTDPDDDPLTHSWTQTAGPPVTLSDAAAAQPTFTAPAGPATLTFELTVADGRGGRATDSVTVTVDGLPTADAGDDADVVERATATLDGTGSTDPDDDPLTYAWTQTAGPPVTLSDAAAARPTFAVPDEPAVLTFELTVDDGRGGRDSDEVTITSLSRFTDDEEWVEHTYLELVGRPGDDAGRDYWVGRLEGGATRLQVATLIGRSLEGTRVHVLAQRYSAWLGRGVDAAEADHWAPRLHAGLPLVDLEVALLASPEMWGRGGGTASGYVDALYEVLLARDPAPGEAAFWAARVGTRGRSTVARELLGTAEVERRRAAAAHLDVLGEEISAEDLDEAAAQLDQHRDLRRLEAAFAARWEQARPA